MAEEKKDERETLEVVYIGRRWYDRIKRFSQLFVLLDDLSPLNLESVDYTEIDRKALSFDQKSKFHAYIGNRYTLPIKRNEEGLVTGYFLSDLKHSPGPTNFVHKSVWVELDKIVTHVKNSDAMQKKTRDDNRAQQSIDHLKWVYNQLPPSHRKAWLISVLMEIDRSTR
ncbi:hypothetical protein EVB81_250 [Rhizobium phage RHph_I46]|uniref:Uncharacterized protein n=1 Tax=Rhizobium phage RHph_I1_9 TaxID=2509729 RepID=A0A7S5R9Q0_9CAUD|nr:hypothetical protein PP936_gp248 [Rhizobium phage RHph_I1_9]QIG69819.1 hypothetical protein EVB81_250 [Rhizobium phage RHph_I46]QIG71100.1 hypothetical protein EVB92_250 [Rhizobium phage RHph_I9]QIG73685.1 hypothetical protein EVC04_248 [Rhizobium phage RHph_I1_9]QIG76439.1 hypothetical protein EVC25_250 [Rhizobium phage RHph_I34]